MHPFILFVQGFSSLSDKVTSGSTVWNISSLPQNRELSMLGAGDGSLYLYKYHYPDQRKVKVSGRGGHMFAQSRDQATEPVQIDPWGRGGCWTPLVPPCDQRLQDCEGHGQVVVAILWICALPESPSSCLSFPHSNNNVTPFSLSPASAGS